VGAIDFVGDYQPGDVFVEGQIISITSDGFAAVASGFHRLVVPFPAKVHRVLFSIEGNASGGVDHGFRFDYRAGGSGNSSTQSLAPLLEREGAEIRWSETDTAITVDANDVIELETDGAWTNSFSGYFQVQYRPTNPSDIPSNTIIFSGEVPVTSSTTYIRNFPVPFDCELVAFQMGVGSNATGGIDATLKVNGSTTVATALSGSVSVGTEYFFRPSASLYLTPSDYLEVEVELGANQGDKHPYNIILRRV
jgi:hypothetical protein